MKPDAEAVLLIRQEEAVIELTRSATSLAVQGGFGARGRRNRPWVSVGCLLLFDVLAHEGDRRTATG